MLTCTDYREMIQTSLDGRLSEIESRELSRHISLCPSCRIDIGISRKLFRILDSMGEIDPPSSIQQSIMASISSMNPSPARSRIPHAFKIMAILTAIISSPFIIWLIRSVLAGFIYDRSLRNPLQESFIIRLFVNLTKSIANLFSDSPVGSFITFMPGSIHPLHRLMVIVPLALAVSILASSLIIVLSWRPKHRLQD